MEDDEVLKQLEEEYAEEAIDSLQKEVNQMDKVEPVTKALADMGTFYKNITKSLVKDNICYVCKKEIGENDKFDIIQVPNEKMEKGLVAFCSVCKKCNKDEV